MKRVSLAALYLVVHIVLIVGLVALVRSTWPATLAAPGGELTVVQAGLIISAWHLPMTAFIYRFVGGDLITMLRPYL